MLVRNTLHYKDQMDVVVVSRLLSVVERGVVLVSRSFWVPGRYHTHVVPRHVVLARHPKIPPSCPSKKPTHAGPPTFSGR